MDDHEPTDFYRIAIFCGLLVVGWMFEVASLRGFIFYRLPKEPPQFHVVDLNQGHLFPHEDPQKPLDQILAEKGLRAGVPLVTNEKGADLLRDYQIKKWSPIGRGDCLRLGSGVVCLATFQQLADRDGSDRVRTSGAPPPS